MKVKDLVKVMGFNEEVYIYSTYDVCLHHCEDCEGKCKEYVSEVKQSGYYRGTVEGVPIKLAEKNVKEISCKTIEGKLKRDRKLVFGICVK